MSTAASGAPSVAQQIRAMDAEFVRLARAKDAAALTEMFYAEDAQLLPPNAPLVRGKAAIRAFWTEFMKIAGDDVDIASDTIEPSGDLVCTVGHWSGTIGGQRAKGKYVVVARRQADGGYKAIADCFNADA
jgi:ketosteroid isomerase-like protein